MATEEIKIKLESSIAAAKDYASQIGKAGGMAPNSKEAQRVSNIIQELESISKLPESPQNLTRFNALFNQLSEILLKASYGVKAVSKEFRAMEKELQDLENQQKDKKTQRGEILKQGRVNKQSGKYELFDTYQNEIITAANIKNAKGTQIKKTDTFFSKFNESGNPMQGAFADPAAAKALYDKLKQNEEENANKLKELNTSIDELQTAIKNKVQELNAQGAKENAPLSGKIIKTKIDVNESTQKRKEEILNQEDENKPTTNVQGTSEALNKQSSALGKAFKQFTLYQVAIRFARKALTEAIQTIKELDKSLTEQAMVTGMTRQQTYGLVKSYQELALATGATTKEIAGVATEYMKQGKTIEDSLVLTEAAVSAAKVARVSVGDSVNYLTTALNGFRLEAEDAMKVSDKFAAVAAASATDYDELAIALSKVASQANLAGMSIDYTTALLTKGLETTREAPETMGTALKTIIARMRELTDYGETLEGDTDINNVETQLKYVDIALRNTSGELRSTEEVLDELGKKWDTLSKNQQAAVAKALAGTRQQSRLIAMMEDYDRVIELQQIAERSEGATSAQASVYLEGIEASLNKISVAWEKIVMTISDSEVIIDLLNFVSTTLEVVADFLSTDWGMTSTLTIVAGLVVSILASKMREKEIHRQQYLMMLKQTAEQKQQEKTGIKNRRIALEAYRDTLKEYKTKDKITEEMLAQAKAKAMTTGDAKLQAQVEAALSKEKLDNLDIDKEIALVDAEINQLKREEQIINRDLAVNQMEQFQNANFLTEAFSSLIPILSVITTSMTLMNTLQMVMTTLRKKDTSEISKQIAKEGEKTAVQSGGMVAGIINAFKDGGIPGIIAGIATAVGVVAMIASIAGIAIGGIVSAVKVAKQRDDSAKAAAKDINELSNQIYKLQEKANAINQVTSSFEDLDNNIIKTKEDLEEMNNLLDKAGDSLSEEEKEVYEKLATNKQKVDYLKDISEKAEKEADAKRRESINRLKATSASDREEILTSKESEFLETQSAIYAINNAALYDYVDLLKQQKELSSEAADAAEQLTQGILEQLSATDAYNIAADERATTIKKMVDVIGKLKNEDGTSLAKILSSSDARLNDQIEAYREIKESIQELGDPKLLDAFKEAYNDFDELADAFSETTLKWIDAQNITYKKLNEIGDAIQDLGYTTKEATILMEDLFNMMEKGEDLQFALQSLFATDVSSDDYQKLLTSLENALGIGVLNIGQNADKIKNSINSIYEKAQEWETMSESDKTQFLQDNKDLFQGEEGAKLLKAFESADYDEIYAALKANDALNEKIQKQKQDLQNQLYIENAREIKDVATIAYIEEQLQELENLDKYYLASLELRLEAEEKQLEEYKKILEEENKARIEALEERKEAYEKYFESVNEQKEEEDYDEQADLLAANLSKLSVDSTGAAATQRAELEKQLEELAEERAQELRERAQEQIIENIDSEIEEANKWLEDILNSQQAMLAVLNGDVSKNGWEGVIAKSIANESATKGLTELGMEKYIQDLQGIYGSQANIDWDKIDVVSKNGDLYLTVNGQDIVNLSSQDQQTVYTAIKAALAQIGFK